MAQVGPAGDPDGPHAEGENSINLPNAMPNPDLAWPHREAAMPLVYATHATTRFAAW